jgi:hypothetical protein
MPENIRGCKARIIMYIASVFQNVTVDEMRCTHMIWKKNKSALYNHDNFRVTQYMDRHILIWKLEIKLVDKAYASHNLEVYMRRRLICN